MKISKKTDYALRVLFGLVNTWRDEPVGISVLAREYGVPKRFLEQIMLKLKKKGWVESRQGKKGGYRLAVAPNAITIGEVVRNFSGVLAPIGCVSVTAPQRCEREKNCPFRGFFKEIRDHTAELLDKATIAEVAAGKAVVRKVRKRCLRK
ncbi:MAG: Rrf2 family transcriptional regulator [Deltaproteobacteria bacterium]|nr:Rrf2 family transcriptional regulator [Deltaproteobacteria bacterium]